MNFDSINRKLERCAREIAAGQPLPDGFSRDALGRLAFLPPYIKEDSVEPPVPLPDASSVASGSHAPIFKVGDRIRVVKRNDFWPVGAEGAITFVDAGGDTFPYRAVMDGAKPVSAHWSADYIEIIPSEAVSPTKHVFKVGDRVLGNWACCDQVPGSVIEGDKAGMVRVLWDDCSARLYYFPKNLELIKGDSVAAIPVSGGHEVVGRNPLLLIPSARSSWLSDASIRGSSPT